MSLSRVNRIATIEGPSALPRRADWPSALCLYIQRRKSTPFAWGSNDCLLFASGAVESMTGVDLAADYRGAYSTARGALRHMRAQGMADLRALCDAHLLARVPNEFAARGDVVAAPGQESIVGGLGLGIVFGGYVWMPGPDGAVPMPLSTIHSAWRI